MEDRSKLLTALERCAELKITTYSNLIWAETSWVIKPTNKGKIEINRCLAEHEDAIEEFQALRNKLTTS